ncbi:SRPBCC domain-containing protein [Sphingomonas sp.]|uniref:SRPBCC family protein n=1 Tax=Sphingomonas sp. TaxID=28214 RepID=UPI001B2AAEA5|nr:SRPBCC domain-containing protein [Sphingomonas sp.]MBO9713669.1 SRPBCC domain-containing protein [Sphingomonas sp.]
MTDAAETRTVTVERDIAHPPEKIWRALTQPHLIAEWLMNNDFVAEVGHRFDFTADWGSVACEVLEIEQGRALAYSWAAMGLESVVTWTLEPSAQGTHLRMEQTGFRTDQEQAYQGAKFGWQRMFGALETLLDRVD